jgi:hypothetical protein
MRIFSASRDLIVLSILFFFGSVSIRGQDFVKVRGEIEITSLRNGLEQGKPRSFPFTCIVSLKDWFFETGFALNAIDSYSFDGTNVIRKTKITSIYEPGSATTPFRPQFPILHSEFATNRESILVTPGSNPLANAGPNLVWLALCSGMHLSKEDPVLPIPANEVRHTIQAFSYKPTITQFDDALRLPKRIEFRADQQTLRKFARSPWIFRSPQRMAEWNAPTLKYSENQGFLKAIYNVEQSTTYRGWNLPTDFTYVQFANSLTDGSSVELRAVGKIIEISDSEPPAPLMQEGRIYSVSDSRFRHPDRILDGLSYSWTNSFLPPTNTPALQERFTKEASRRPLNFPEGE